MVRVLIGLVSFLAPFAAAAHEEAPEPPSRAELGSLVERKGPFSGPDLPRVWSPKPRPPTPVIVAPPAPPTSVQVVVTAPEPPLPVEVSEPAYMIPAPILRTHRHRHSGDQGSYFKPRNPHAARWR